LGPYKKKDPQKEEPWEKGLLEMTVEVLEVALLTPKVELQRDENRLGELVFDVQDRNESVLGYFLVNGVSDLVMEIAAWRSS